MTTGPEAPSQPEENRLDDAPPPDKATPEAFESEGGADRDGPVAIT